MKKHIKYRHAKDKGTLFALYLRVCTVYCVYACHVHIYITAQIFVHFIFNPPTHQQNQIRDHTTQEYVHTHALDRETLSLHGQGMQESFG